MGNTHNTSLARKSCDKSWQEYNTYFQAITADIFSKELITKEESKNIIRTLLGKEFARSRMVSVNGFINHNGRLATGMAADGYIYLAVLSKGVRFSSGYHEAMHIIWEDIIDPVARQKYEHLARKIALMETGRELYGTDLKEWMASNFAKHAAYKAGKLTHDDISSSWRVNAKEMTLWQKFKAVMHEILNFFIGYRKRMNKFYDDILGGKYRNSNLEGNTYNHLEEVVDDEYSSMEVSGNPEWIYDKSERAKKAERYLELNNKAKEYFPDVSKLPKKLEVNTRYNLLLDSYLGNVYNENKPITDNFREAIEKEISKKVQFNRELGEIEVINNGKRVKIKDVAVDQYENIEMPEDYGGTLSERVEEAKSNLRTFFMTQRENVETVMGHMIPDYSPDSRHIRRAKAGNVKFEDDLNDPYSDGFTAEMNFHFESIPRLSVQNRRYTFNQSAYENSFLDPRKAKNVYIRLGKRTREIYEADLSKDPDTANKINAFKKALEQEIAAHAGE